MTGLIDFSIDAPSNDVAAPPINFVEGQPANSVNNSSRALMAALACWRDDTCAGLTATGAAGNLLTLGTNQVVKASNFTTAFELSFLVDGTNTGPVTLAVDGNAARPVRRPRNLPLGPGDLIPAVVYRVLYLPSLSVFLVVSPEIAPPGMVAAFGAAAAIPPGWLECDGEAVSRTSHAALFARIGSTWGAGDGTTTFNLPDARGRALFGRDGGTGRLTATGGLVGNVGQVGGTQAHILTLAQMPAHDHGGQTDAAGGQDAAETGLAGGRAAGETGEGGEHSHTGTTGAGGIHSHTGTTNQVPNHTHPSPTASIKNAPAGDGGTTTSIFWAGTETTTNSGGGGVHDHTLTISDSSSHTHGFTTQSASAHRHSLPAVADHRHALPAVAAHQHVIASAGSGAAHPTIPPGAVVIFAIKT